MMGVIVPFVIFTVVTCGAAYVHDWYVEKKRAKMSG
jgi:hypothetical protein